MNVQQFGMFDTIEIPLTRGYVTVIDAVDADLMDLKWHARPNRTRNYAEHSTSRGPNMLLHRIILERVIGRALQPGELPDHRDNDPLNNRRSNLRIATVSENMANSKLTTKNTSGFRGVSFHNCNRKWIAAIRINGESVYLGSFATPEAAHAVYREAAIKHYGEFARFE